ncbi:hypothetical protein [Maritimibacter alkaliphilus]|uniref:hypothetical protein n=1 Tax=Maritimibacter alkaliphilus TaxID=404236 RepID=UPI001C974F8C|nr:hypothetical protein [Maritimibacter alkaliphilus]MBY6091058.1 hypothetical protein [Maritimibacter alkaliphilus]
MAKNMSLPVLPAWHARSFYAALLLAATVLCNVVGLDLMQQLERLGLGASSDQVVDRIMMLAPLIFGVWAWWERKAPHYRLSLDPGDRRSQLRAFLARVWTRLTALWIGVFGRWTRQ